LNPPATVIGAAEGMDTVFEFTLESRRSQGGSRAQHCRPGMNRNHEAPHGSGSVGVLDNPSTGKTGLEGQVTSLELLDLLGRHVPRRSAAGLTGGSMRVPTGEVTPSAPGRLGWASDVKASFSGGGESHPRGGRKSAPAREREDQGAVGDHKGLRLQPVLVR